MWRDNQYRLIKDGKSYNINTHKDKSNISLVSANQAKKLISSSKKYVFLFLRENLSDDESMRVKESMEGCTKENKILEEFLQEYKGVFKDPKGIPPKRDVENIMQLFRGSLLLNIGMYRQSVLEANEVKKQLHQLLEQSVIQPRTSPCGSPIIIVPKKDQTWRMCIDYMELKKITLKNRYTMPRIDDLFDQKQHDKYFTKLDLKSRYHQV